MSRKDIYNPLFRLIKQQSQCNISNMSIKSLSIASSKQDFFMIKKKYTRKTSNFSIIKNNHHTHKCSIILKKNQQSILNNQQSILNNCTIFSQSQSCGHQIDDDVKTTSTKSYQTYEDNHNLYQYNKNHNQTNLSYKSNNQSESVEIDKYKGKYQMISQSQSNSITNSITNSISNSIEIQQEQKEKEKENQNYHHNHNNNHNNHNNNNNHHNNHNKSIIRNNNNHSKFSNINQNNSISSISISNNINKQNKQIQQIQKSFNYYNNQKRSSNYVNNINKNNQSALSFRNNIKKKTFNNTQNITKLSHFILSQQPIGQGTYSKVYKAFHKKTGMIFALKIFNKNRIKQLKLINNLIQQIKIMTFCQHESISKIYGYFQQYQNYYLIMQYCTNGQLYSLIKNYNQKDKDNKQIYKKKLNFLRQLCQAIEYLHQNNIMHRDIKPQNILLTIVLFILNNFMVIMQNQQISDGQNTQKTKNNNFVKPSVVHHYISPPNKSSTTNTIKASIYGRLEFYHFNYQQVKYPSRFNHLRI